MHRQSSSVTMAKAVIRLEINSPEAGIVGCMVEKVELPGVLGRFMVLRDHAPLITALTEGQVRYVGEDGIEESVPIKSGFVEINKNKVSVCVEL